MKRFATFLLVLAMILSLAIPAFAETNNGKITVKKAQAGEIYAVYKMFDLKVDDEIEPKAYTYTINKDWVAFFTGEGAGAAYITFNEKTEAVDAVLDAAGLAKAACEWAESHDDIEPFKSDDGKGADLVFDGLENGYWLITSTLGTQAMIDTTPDKNDVEVNEKNSTNTIEKQVYEDSTKSFGESNDAQVGDTVYFKSIVNIVKNTRNVVVHDQMTTGLTFKPDSVVIKDLNKEGNPTLTAGKDYELILDLKHDDTFDIEFDQDWIDGLTFDKDGINNYEITYSAILNENAVQNNNLVNQENKTYVSFGDGSSSTQDTTDTHTHKFAVYKHATGVQEHLAGAEFKLMQGDTVIKLIKLDDNNYRVAKPDEEGAVETFVTVAKNDIIILGVDKEEYTLVETKAPDGYNKLDKSITVEVDGANATRITVANKSGTELPSTGGVGTTMFYIFGGILVLAAVVLLVTKKRMAVAE